MAWNCGCRLRVQDDVRSGQGLGALFFAGGEEEQRYGLAVLLFLYRTGTDGTERTEHAWAEGKPEKGAMVSSTTTVQYVYCMQVHAEITTDRHSPPPRIVK
jgi:hypothetical protein